MKKIAQRIEKMRSVWRLTKEKVASEIGLSLDNYEKLESGISEIAINTAMKLCDLFQISLDFLMTGTISEKDNRAINRPLTKEEKISDAIDQIKNKYSEYSYNKFSKYLYAIYIDRNDKDNGIWFEDNFKNNINRCIALSNNHIKYIDYVKLNDFTFFKELCENGVFSSTNLHKHPESSSVDNILSYNTLIPLLQDGSVTDEGFVDYAISLDPVKTLNYYFLTDSKIQDKKGILKCLDKGGYVEKCVNIKYYYDDETGETSKTYEFGKDSLATMLLSEHCLK